ncbi:hypothetical protein GJ496_007571 [Pomphorhynchus laevis]|nr:hypothetical protein GJ496_007571 [Pomphorhynchus laevis]
MTSDVNVVMTGKSPNLFKCEDEKLRKYKDQRWIGRFHTDTGSSPNNDQRIYRWIDSGLIPRINNRYRRMSVAHGNSDKDRGEDTNKFVLNNSKHSMESSSTDESVPEYIKLISADDRIFIVRREYALISNYIRTLLNAPIMYAETKNNEIRFKDIAGHVLEKICKYFIYKSIYQNCPVNIPTFPIEPEMALELLMAANYLDC